MKNSPSTKTFLHEIMFFIPIKSTVSHKFLVKTFKFPETLCNIPRSGERAPSESSGGVVGVFPKAVKIKVMVLLVGVIAPGIIIYKLVLVN